MLCACVLNHILCCSCMIDEQLRQDALKAQAELKGYVLHGRTLEVNSSDDNRRLRIANVDPVLDLEGFKALLEPVLKVHNGYIKLELKEEGAEAPNK